MHGLSQISMPYAPQFLWHDRDHEKFWEHVDRSISRTKTNISFKDLLQTYYSIYKNTIKDPKPFGNFTSLSFKTNDDVDCKNARRRTVSQIHYSEHMLQGQENPVDIAEIGKWQPWDPTLPSYLYFKTLCNQK
jgi:hypothetical protein